MDINLELYKIFYTVAKYKSMTKAAAELLVSQPAISKSIQTLEGQLGGTLFLRSNKGLELTEEGKNFYTKIGSALSLINDAENSFGDFKDLKVGEIKIGISSVLTKVVLLDTLGKFRELYPNIKISITNGLTSDLLYELNKGKLDFVIFNDKNVDEKNVELMFLTTLVYKFIYNENFYDLKNVHTLNDLLNYPLILQKDNSNTRKTLNDFSVKNGVTLQPQMETVSQDLICEFTRCGLGVGFAFEKLIDKNYSELKKINLKEEVRTKILIATNKYIYPTSAAGEFIKILKNNF